VTKRELVAWVLLMALLGVGIGLVVLRPWDHHVAISLSGSQTQSPVGQVAPSPGGTCPDIAVHKADQPSVLHVLPRQAWVHASDGVNVRAAPSPAAARLTTLAVGTALTVEAEQTNSPPDGNTWYRIRLTDGRDGWLVSGFTTNYPITANVTDALKIWLPSDYQFRALAAGNYEARYNGAPLALLYLESGVKQQVPGQQAVPSGLPARSNWKTRATEQVLVGDHAAMDHVSRVLLSGSCPAIVHEVAVTTTTRYYDFLFVLDEPSSSVVAQLLDSATLQ
jgi:Bacterial SH3 domain